MWYRGNDGNTLRIGHAISPKGINISVSPDRDSLNRSNDTVRVIVRVPDPLGLSFSVEVESPDGTTNEVMSLFDDGAHGDSLANDGIFANSWIPGYSLSYFFDLKLMRNSLAYEVDNIAAYNKVASGVKRDELLPHHYNLGQNFPNPFNPSTEIQFSLPHRNFVTLKIFDLLGREVATLVSEELSAGNYSTRWDAAGMPSGVYFYRLQAGEFVETKKLLLLR
jgi:hypothetical protein